MPTVYRAKDGHAKTTRDLPARDCVAGGRWLC